MMTLEEIEQKIKDRLMDGRGQAWRPNGQWPVPEAIKGYWCSGSGEDYDTICAVVDAPTPEQAWEAIEASWPDRGEERFCEEKPNDWRPGNRFPWKDHFHG